jgi:hypothetical protein
MKVDDLGTVLLQEENRIGHDALVTHEASAWRARRPPQELLDVLVEGLDDLRRVGQEGVLLRGSVSMSMPGLQPVPSAETPLSRAALSSRATMSGWLRLGSRSSSHIDATSVPREMRATRTGSMPSIQDEVATTATSASGKSSVEETTRTAGASATN